MSRQEAAFTYELLLYSVGRYIERCTVTYDDEKESYVTVFDPEDLYGSPRFRLESAAEVADWLQSFHYHMQ